MPTQYDRLPNHEAIAHFNGKVLLTTGHYAELKAYEHALAFTVARIADKDILTEVHKAMTQAIENGTTFHDFQKQLKPYLTARGWLGLTDNKADKRYLGHRLKTIYQTNVRTAYAAGQWTRIQKTKDLLPYLQYMPSVSTHKRDEHKQYYGLVRPVDDPIWRSIAPPNGFGCKCWVRQLTKGQAERAGVSDLMKLETEQVKHPLTGELMDVPKGVHFSFDHNHDRLTAMIKLARDKHGSEFASKIGLDLKREMVSYAEKQGMTVTSFGGITARPNEVARLQKELDGRISTQEAIVGDEWQQKYDVELERFNPDIHKVLVKGKNADYATMDLTKDPKDWVTLDFMFAMAQDEADRMSGQILGTITSPKKKYQERYDKMWDNLQAQILLHLDKADIVPMDLRKLDPRLVVKIIGFVLSLDKELSKNIVFIQD